MNKIDVLDHGFVRLVSYMQPYVDLSSLDDPEFGGTAVDLYMAAHQKWTGDLEIVRNARVSHDADWRTGEDEGSDDRLIRRMEARNHTSPKEAMVFTFEVKAPIFVFRQWHRHRTWSYNELSARYAPMKEEFYIPAFDQIRVQDKKEKQATSAILDQDQASLAQRMMYASCDSAFGMYMRLLNMGVAREIARCVLPVNTYSRMFATVNLHNLFKFLILRLDSHAQYEIRVYAEAILRLIEPVCPTAVAAFKTERMKEEPLTDAERAAIIDAISVDIDVNGDDETDAEDTIHYQRLRSALAKLEGVKKG